MNKKFEEVWTDYHLTGKICFEAIDHYVSADLDEFTSQPVDGMLYDLGLLPENLYALARGNEIDFESFVEKLSYGETIRYLSNKLDDLKKQLAELQESINKNVKK